MVKSFMAKGGNLERARIAPGMLMQFLARKEDTNGEFALPEMLGMMAELNDHYGLIHGER